MSTETTTKNEENVKKESNSLMRKTKAQLVDIILRKDNIECNLRNDIKDKDNLLNSYQEKLTEANRQIDSKNKAYETLKADFESTCDENASTICELKGNISRKNDIIIKLCIGLIATFVIILCLCFL